MNNSNNTFKQTNSNFSNSNFQFFKCFFAYDMMKFQQFMNKSNQMSKCNKTFSNKKRRRNRVIRNKNKENKEYLPNMRIMENLNEIKAIQRKSDFKIDFLYTRSMNELRKDYKINSFEFEIIQNAKFNDQNYDYFSFKIKPDLSLTSSVNDLKNSNTGERNSISSNFKKMKCHSPDRLISHKFFEDTEHFRNSNLMSVKTFMNDAALTSNPFCVTTKSDSEIGIMEKYKVNNLNQTDKESTFDKLFKSEEKKENSENNSLNIEDSKHTHNANEDHDISISMMNFSEGEKKTKRSDNLSHNLHISEEENNYYDHGSDKKVNHYQLKKMKTDIEYTSQTISDNNDTVSVNSSKMNVECSQEKFKKVRGFNFKNNINTKKYNKPLFNAKTKVEEKEENKMTNSTNNMLTNNKLIDSGVSSQSSFNVNKSSNLEEKVKIKKLNFNNNINIKKFIRQEIGNTGSHKEREKQYAVEIEESEQEPIVIADLKK